MVISKKRKRKSTDIEEPAKTILKIPEPKEEVYNLRKHIYEIDFEDEFENIKEWLQFRPKTPSQIEDALFDAGNISNKAQLLIENIKLEEKKYSLECTERLEILRTNAIKALEEEKKENAFKKQITNQMIEDKILAEHSTLYIGVKQKQNELKSIRSLVENIYEQVKNREVNLRKILDSQSYHKGKFAWANREK